MTASATIRIPQAELAEPVAATSAPDVPVTRRRHINWALKAILPIAAVLLNGLLLFILISLSLEIE